MGTGQNALLLVDVQNDFCEGGSLADSCSASDRTQLEEEGAELC